MANFSVGVVIFAGLVLQASSNNCLIESLLYGCTSWKSDYEHICCEVPQHWAEHSGFLREPDVNFFPRLERMEAAAKSGGESGVADAAGAASLDGVHIQKNSETGDYEWVFYDSQCGMPLFVAPRGRTFRAWRDESVDHGWPSFRDEEVVNNAVIEYNGGEVVSACPSPTHLGHNLPDGKGNRYCINVICIAGQYVEQPGNSSVVPNNIDNGESGENSERYLQLQTGQGTQSGASAPSAAAIVQPLVLLQLLWAFHRS